MSTAALFWMNFFLFLTVEIVAVGAVCLLFRWREKRADDEQMQLISQRYKRQALGSKHSPRA